MTSGSFPVQEILERRRDAGSCQALSFTPFRSTGLSTEVYINIRYYATAFERRTQRSFEIVVE